VEYQTIRISLETPVARLTLARPEAGNRVGLRTLRELADACEAIAGSTDMALVVVAADGPDFCAGWEDDARSELQRDTGHLDPFGCLAALPAPVLAAVHGRAASAGLELALACDLRLAHEDARFVITEAVEGRVPLAGATARLPRIAGRTVAGAMLLLGEELNAAAAYRCGLVSRVFAAGDFESDVGALVTRVAANGPLGLRYAKEAVLNGIELPLDQALRYELDLSVILQTTHDRAEGVQAFLEKRNPNFDGR
jgi:enoyl-CoA hydratase/carnithine racemase